MNQNTLQDWASTRIADFLGFGPEDAVPMVQYLLTFQTSDELAGHLQEMLGVSQEATAFIQEFIENRFPSKGGINSTNQDTQPFKANEPTKTKLWKDENNVYRKSDKDEVYMPGRTTKKSKKKAKEQSLLISDKLGPSKASSGQVLPEASASLKEEDSKNSKKKKGLTTAEWEEQYNKLMKETAATRAPCDCLATKHPLLTNCLNCGKIICAREGPGPCMFCNTPVFSQEQQIELLLELKKAKKAKSKSNFRRKVPAGQKSNMLYLDKVTGLSTHSRSDAEDAEALAKAQAHKDQLLEYDRTSARRSHVIDQAADFNMPVDPSDKWLSPQEKALALKLYQEQEKRKAFEEDRRKRGTHSITIDLLGRKVVTGPVIEAPDDGVKETLQELEKLKLEEARKSQSSKGSGYYAQNPLLKGVSAPKFISSKERSTSNQLSEEGLPRKKDSRRRVKLDHLDEDASKNASAAGAYSKET
ncbi:zf-C2HC5-domain-containing protein [Basidiobolus meristosporus CBS 931.73]|uniref:Zf-C2HC5-domain-containing protein n=1 Tax=Basidiobolus meristosporus CBS 931.73 TaxID=1314790 RepID=A0A1Y1YQ73_9FUNG|nr:zf-C2HC5-domain-containing protein [Basidiobolus meristosporus CBS 931.73]|eukprot:ORY00116.1 zf-C2HC5-domain-containing protein [Basidiobolus meristosporus CBS 931.73]